MPGCDSLPSVMQRVFVWFTVAMAALIAVLAGHLVTAMSAGGPVAVPDVPAYLSIAQWVGGDGLAPTDVPFQPGYGLLVAPLVAVSQVSLLGTQGEVVHLLGLVVNTLAAVAAVVVAGRLGFVWAQRWWVAGAAGLIAAVHPSLSSASRIAWSETLLGLAVLLAALAVAGAALHAGTATSWRWWGRAGLLATLAVALHARMVVLVVAVVMTALACRISRRDWSGLVGGLLVGGTAAAVALTLTHTWPTARLNEAAQLDRGVEPIVTVSGQLLALGGGTVGLGLLGLIAGLSIAVRLVRRWPGNKTGSPNGIGPLAASALFVSLGALGAVVLGGWTLTGSDRADALLYGRYVDPWAVPLTAVAIAWLATRCARRRRDSHVLAISAAVALAACAVVIGAADAYDAPSRRIMTLSFSPAWTWLDGRLPAVAVAGFIAVLLGVLLAAVAQRRHSETDPQATIPPPDAEPDNNETPDDDETPDDEAVQGRMATGPVAALGALVAAALALGATATVLNHRHLADVGAVARDQVTAAHTVADAVDNDGLACLAHDRTSVPDYALWLYRLELPEIAHERVRLSAGDRPCSELVIADDDLGERCTNARHLIDEPAASWALWHLPARKCTGV